ncbi:MAG TPA: phosphoethanolamine--lipid A transferase [Moraxellaceae bacterium]|nr:phosphoethanolamine--lipid A transferase [Moraxellaceae bacterium]
MTKTTTDGRKAWPPETVLLLVAGLLALPCNLTLWSRAMAAQPPVGLHGYLFYLAGLALLTAAFFLVLAILPLRYPGRILLSVLLPLSALTVYFMHQYGVAVDDRMVQSVFETDHAEVWQLVSLKMLFYVVMLGVAPVILLWRTPLVDRPLLPAVRARLMAMGTASLVIVLVAIFFYQGFASLFRNHRELRFYLVPNNFISGLRHYAFERASSTGPLSAVGLDAHRVTKAVRHRPVVVVLVIGETARADHFSLLGYDRLTNPELSKERGLITFTDVHSCGTETAVSLPCMLSGLGRADFSPAKAATRENLLDVVRHTGVDVVWIENQSGCKRTCDRVTRINTPDLQLPEYCHGGECHDEILIEALKRQLASLQRDTLVVLHQMGSHGPDYYLRYPAPAFESFTPVCRTNLLDQCTHDQIVNAYDNTILYTDHVLAGLIDTLRSDSHVDSAFYYLSDHGESLGEYGLYLHGAPRLVAPEAQIHIPMLAWLSDGFQRRTGIQRSCVAARRQDPVTQDNLFHSVLGLLNVRTLEYDSDLDLFRRCAASRG